MKDKIIFLDTETTDTSPEPWMIQLWYIVCDLHFNEIKRENLFFHLEDKEIDIWAMAIHHITPKILTEKLKQDSRDNKEKKNLAIEDFKNAYLVAHNSPFDKNVLTCNWVITEDDQWIDSYNIAYSIFTDDDMKHSLQYLRYYFKCEFEEIIDAHDAISDVIVLKEVFRKIYEKYMETWTWWNPFEELVEQTSFWIILRKWMFGKYNWRSIEETFKIDRWYFEWMYGQKKKDWNTDDAVFNTLKHYLWLK